MFLTRLNPEFTKPFSAITGKMNLFPLQCLIDIFPVFLLAVFLTLHCLPLVFSKKHRPFSQGSGCSSLANPENNYRNFIYHSLLIKKLFPVNSCLDFSQHISPKNVIARDERRSSSFSKYALYYHLAPAPDTVRTMSPLPYPFSTHSFYSRQAAQVSPASSSYCC